MKVLVINTNPMGPDGITNVICNLFRAMDKQGMRMDLLAINEPQASVRALFEEAGGSVNVLSRSLSHPVRYMNTLKHLIKQGGYDAVHVHGNSATLTLEMAAAWLGGCKVRIAHSHNTTCKFMAIHRVLTPVFRTLCTHRLACGVDAGKWLYGKKDFTVVNNGVDTARFAFREEARGESRRVLGIGDDTKLIGHVGIFNEAKNQSFLVEVLKNLGSEYKILLLGQGRLRESVEQKVREMELFDRVIFGGVTDRVENYLCAFDMLVMPSLYEGLPLALIEAQANGLQCVVSENITREVDKTGNLTFLSLDTGAEHWAQTVRDLKLPADRAKASRLAIEKIKESGYDIHTEATRLREYYQRAIGGTK